MRGRGRLAAALLILGGLLLLAASPALWLRATALNTDRWTETVSPLPSSEPVADALAEYTVSEVIGEENLLQLSGLLPDRFDALPGTASARLNGLAEGIASEAIASPAFEGVWSAANRAAHEAALAALDGDVHPALQEDGMVVLDLSPIISSLREEITAAGVDLPAAGPGDGRIEVISLERRSAIVRSLDLLRRGAPALAVLAVLLLIGSVLVAARRPRALTWVGVVVAVVGAGTLALLRVGRSETEAAAAAEVDAAAVVEVWDVLARSLVVQSLAITILGLVIAAAGWALGSSPSALRMRREPGAREAPPGDALPALRVGGVVAALLLVLLWPDPRVPVLLGAAALAIAWWVASRLLVGPRSA